MSTAALRSPVPTTGVPLASLPVLDVRAYSFWYGPTQALFDVSVAMPRRAVTALIGPSGCGKTTFLRSINRLNELIPLTPAGSSRPSGSRHCSGAARCSRTSP